MSSLLEDTVEQALRLEPRERLQLIERLASSVERELSSTSAEAAPSGGHWGKAVVALLDELGPVEFVDPEITDPVEWVKAQRRKDEVQRTAHWNRET